MIGRKALMALAVTSATLVNVSQAWWGTGHMLGKIYLFVHIDHF